MNSVDSLISEGRFQEALDIVWSEIDSGNDSARIQLANIFTANGLHSFAQDQWVFLLENDSELRVEAALGIAANLLWLRAYQTASDTIKGIPGSNQLEEAITSGKNKDPLIDPLNLGQIASEVLQDEANLLQELAESSSIEAQTQLIQVRDVISNIAAIVSFKGNEHLRALQFDLAIGPNSSVPRSLGEQFKNPKDFLVNTAHACAVQIRALSQNSGNLESIHFKNACKIGQSSFEKIFLLSGEIYSPKDANEAYAFQTVAWGLSSLGLLSGFVYGGLLED